MTLLPTRISNPPIADHAWAKGVLGTMKGKSFMVIIDIGRRLPISRSVTRVLSGTRDSVLEALIGPIVPS